MTLLEVQKWRLQYPMSHNLHLEDGILRWKRTPEWVQRVGIYLTVMWAGGPLPPNPEAHGGGGGGGLEDQWEPYKSLKGQGSVGHIFSASHFLCSILMQCNHCQRNFVTKTFYVCRPTSSYSYK